MSNTEDILSETGITLHGLLGSPPVFMVESVLLIYLFFSAVLFSFDCLRHGSSDSNIARVSGMSIRNYPFGFL